MFNQDHIGEDLRVARGDFHSMPCQASAHQYVTEAGNAYRGGVFGDIEYSEVLREVSEWLAQR